MLLREVFLFCNKDNVASAKSRCMTFADCRLQTADCRLQTADCRPQTADRRLQTGSTRKILLTVTSSSTTFPTTQNNINLVEKILLDFLWWFTVMVLDSR